MEAICSYSFLPPYTLGYTSSSPVLCAFGYLHATSLFRLQLQPSDATIHSGRLKSIREAKSWRPVMHPTGSAIHGSLDNFIATGGVAPTGGCTGTGSGSGSLLGDPSRPLGGGNDTDHWNSLNGGGNRRGGTSEINDDSDDKKDVWLPENDVEIEDSGEFQVLGEITPRRSLDPSPSESFCS